YQEGYLLTEKIPDAVDLHAFVDDLGRLSPGQRRGILRRLLDGLARLVRELHRRHLANRDLKAANILLQAQEDPALWLIDLVGVTRPRRLSRARRVQNLARLNASFLTHPGLTRTDRLRFLRVYQQWNLFGRHRWKRWWREVEEASQAKAARNRTR